MTEGHRDSVRRLLDGLGAQMPMSASEFRFRVEPLRSQHEASVRVLVELLRAEPPTRDVAVAALHELARPEDAPLLATAFRDHAHATPLRAEIAQVLTGVAAERLEELLEPEEIHDLSLLSIDTLLERMRDPAGLGQVVELYVGSSATERQALLDSLDEATRRPGARMRFGAALDALFDHETDDANRASMIRRLSNRTEPSAARALQRWLAHSHGGERGRILGALRKLGRAGVRPGPRSLEAWISGSDATGSFHVGISFPAALDLRDLVLVCVQVESGLRSVNVIGAAASGTAREIRRALEEGQSIPVAAIDVPAALRMIEEARQRTLTLGRELPDGYATAAHHLQRPVAVAEATIRPALRPIATRAQIAALADVPPYASWAFGESDVRFPASTDPSEAPSAHRLEDAVRATLRGLEKSGGDRRLIAMLDHQAEVHVLRGEITTAERSLAAARAIEEHGLQASPLARRLVERSVVARLVHGPRAPRADVRHLLRHAIEERFAIRRRAVAVLDLAEVLYRQLENLGERAAAQDRLTPAQMETLARAAAEVCVSEFSRDTSDQPLLPGLEQPVRVSSAMVRGRVESESDGRRLVELLRAQVQAVSPTSTAVAERFAAALAAAGRWFAGEVCLRLCRRGCLREPESDGRALFFSRVHPAGLDDPGTAERTAGASSSAGARALRDHMAQTLDERSATAHAFLDALGSLGVESIEASPRVRRARAIVERLRALRRETDRFGEDPAWIYALVEEHQALERESGAIFRQLLATSLGSLVPRPQQFAGFRVYPEVVAADRRLRREMQRVGIVGLPPRALRTVTDRLATPASLLALLRGVADLVSRAQLARLEAALDGFWRHTPRSALGGRTPATVEAAASART